MHYISIYDILYSQRYCWWLPVAVHLSTSEQTAPTVNLGGPKLDIFLHHPQNNKIFFRLIPWNKNQQLFFRPPQKSNTNFRKKHRNVEGLYLSPRYQFSSGFGFQFRKLCIRSRTTYFCRRYASLKLANRFTSVSPISGSAARWWRLSADSFRQPTLNLSDSHRQKAFIQQHLGFGAYNRNLAEAVQLDCSY